MERFVPNEIPGEVQSKNLCFLFESFVDRRNHYGHDGTHDPKVAYAFDGNVRLFLKESGQERIETIRSSDYRTLGALVLYLRRSSLLLPMIEIQDSFIFLQRLIVPHFRHYNLTNRECSIKVGSLKHDGGFHQEVLYRVNIIGVHSGFINEDAPVNEVGVVQNTFGSELAKTDAQYPNGDTRFPG
ncbi:uncharacterized protein A4U43_C09F12860 [Asparagus officinalis]|uniref:Uncharacterized protein n=1 Tax=Asparagus officinalis TaxID=4686 RepID=A0A5P1EC07_ASPOF|nr:uncharacterized protein A4U43_C09F12860 [Asparagus officinalis]